MPNSNVFGGNDMEHVAAKYQELQDELRILVGQFDSPYTADTMVRHAYEGSIKLYDAVILAELIEAERPGRILELRL